MNPRPTRGAVNPRPTRGALFPPQPDRGGRNSPLFNQDFKCLISFGLPTFAQINYRDIRVTSFQPATDARTIVPGVNFNTSCSTCTPFTAKLRQSTSQMHAINSLPVERRPYSARERVREKDGQWCVGEDARE